MTQPQGESPKTDVPRLADGTRVHVRSDHFAGECDGLITAGYYDAGGFYRIDVTSSDRLDGERNADGELWVCDFEVRPLPGGRDER